MNSTAPKHTRKAEESGILSFDGALISYTSGSYGSFSIPLAEVAIIGEFTTDNGPFVDDWFLVFVHRSGTHWFEASMFAEGSDPLFEKLSAALGCPMHGAMANSVDFDSRIIWPASLADRPLFTFGPARGSSFLRRLKLYLLPEVIHTLSDDALSVIKRTT